jgi:ABC-type nitrate/sulfonate/bicarbonate transport system permease component
VDSLQASLARLGAGLMVGAATGLATGALLALSRQARDFATPTMAALAAVLQSRGYR